MVNPNGTPSNLGANQAPNQTEPSVLGRLGGVVVHVAIEALDFVASHGGGQVSTASIRSAEHASVDRRPTSGDFTAFDHPLPSQWGSTRRT